MMVGDKVSLKDPQSDKLVEDVVMYVYRDRSFVTAGNARWHPCGLGYILVESNKKG